MCGDCSGVQLETALLRAGMPPKVNTYDESLAKEAYALATRWHT